MHYFPFHFYIPELYPPHSHLNNCRSHTRLHPGGGEISRRLRHTYIHDPSHHPILLLLDIFTLSSTSHHSPFPRPIEACKVLHHPNCIFPSPIATFLHPHWSFPEFPTHRMQLFSIFFTHASRRVVFASRVKWHLTNHHHTTHHYPSHHIRTPHG